MKNVLWLVLAVSLASSAAAADKRLDKLSPEHRKWIEEEVVYVISDQEKDLFLSLGTYEERQAFIEAFWRRRDPNAATPQNEYKDEHYRRIEYANKFLGRETFRKGWQTDRGRMYILLGEPREIQRYDGYNELTPSELWFYEGDSSKGLPSFFYLLFFKRHGVGEYQLYHPVADGPTALLQGRYTPGTPTEEVMEQLQQISPELATASLSFDTGDPPDLVTFRPSIGTDVMLARIYDSPKRAVRTDYADAWSRYGKKVSAEYSFNYINSRSYFAVFTGPEETPFVHYSLEIDAQNFSMETDEDKKKYYTTLDVSVEAKDKEGRTIAADEKEVYLELTPSQIEVVKAAPFSYQDDFPLVPGEYTLTVILRNRVLKQYTVAEKEIKTAALAPGAPMLGDVVLGYASEFMSSTAPGDMRVFQLGGYRVQPSAEAAFPIGDTVHVFVQLGGATPEHQLHFALMNGAQVVQERTVAVGQTAGVVVEQMQLANMVGGDYTMRVTLLDPSGKTLSEKTAPIRVSPLSSIARPWAYRRSFNTQEPGLLAMARGEQLLRQKRTAEARAELEKAVAAGNPKLVMATWRLAGLLLEAGDAERALALLTPLEASYPKQFEVVTYLGYGYYLKRDFPKALGYFERAATIRPPDVVLLNALGDCYQATGDVASAKATFKRSLDLDANQPRVKERLDSLGKS